MATEVNPIVNRGVDPAANSHRSIHIADVGDIGFDQVFLRRWSGGVVVNRDLCAGILADAIGLDRHGIREVFVEYGIATNLRGVRGEGGCISVGAGILYKRCE